MVGLKNVLKRVIATLCVLTLVTSSTSMGISQTVSANTDASVNANTDAHEWEILTLDNSVELVNSSSKIYYQNAELNFKAPSAFAYDNLALYMKVNLADEATVANMKSCYVELSQATCDVAELQWKLTNQDLQIGENEICLKFSDAENNTVEAGKYFDLTSEIDWFRIFGGDATSTSATLESFKLVDMTEAGLKFGETDTYLQLSNPISEVPKTIEASVKMDKQYTEWTLATVDQMSGGKTGTGTTTSGEAPGEGITYANMSLSSDAVFMVGQVLDPTPNFGEYTKEDLALSFWYYAETAGTMAGTQIELSSNADDMDNNEMTWYPPLIQVQAGWNYIELPLDGSNVADTTYSCTDTFDLNNIETIRWFKTNSATSSFKVTDLKIVAIEPQDEWTLITVEENSNKTSTGVTTSGEAPGEGVTYANMSFASGTNYIAYKTFTALDFGNYTKSDLALTFWYYSDTAGTLPGGWGQIELASSTTDDVEEMYCQPRNVTVQAGWNYIELPLTDEYFTDVDKCNLSNLVRIRWYKTGDACDFRITDIKLTVNNISVVQNVDESLLSEYTIFSNMNNGVDGDSYALFITKDKRPAILIGDTQYTLNYKVNTGEWVDIAVTNDTSLGNVSFYIDGQVMGTCEAQASSLSDVTTAYCIGADATGNQLMNGSIADIRLWNDVRSAQEIKDNLVEKKYHTEHGLADTDGLIGSWFLYGDIQDVTQEMPDASNTKINAVFRGTRADNWLDYDKTQYDFLYSESEEDYWSMVFIPDIQNLTNGNGRHAKTWLTISEWIADNVEAENIQHVIGAGDTTGANATLQYQIAKEGFDKFMNKVSWSNMIGECDYAENRDSTMYQTYFGEEVIKSTAAADTYVEYYADPDVLTTTENSYYRFSVNGVKWMVLQLENDPRASVIDWAKGVLGQYPLDNVILTMHSYISGDGTSYLTTEDVWGQLSNYTNIKFILCGHSTNGTGAIVKQDAVNVDGNLVPVLMMNAEDLDSSYDSNKALGMIGILRFSADGSKVAVQYYAPQYDKSFNRDFNGTTLTCETETRTPIVKEYTAAKVGTAPTTDVPEGYVFAGWFTDGTCQNPLKDEWTLVTAEENGNKVSTGVTVSGEAPGEGVTYANMSIDSGTKYIAYKTFTALDFGSYSKDDLALSFWYYSDTAGTLPGGWGQIELSSSTTDDVEEMYCQPRNITVQTGWNYIELPLTDAYFTDVASCDISNLVRIRWYKTGNACDFKITDLKIVVLESKKNEGTTAYAKFVDENILRVKAQITADATAVKDTVDIRFITTVDSLSYRNVGFEITINGKKRTALSNKVYSKLYAVGDSTDEILTVTPTEFCSLSKYFKTYTVKNVPNLSFGTVITVRPRWTTLDGTLVYGELAKKTVNMGIFETESVDYGMIFNCDSKEYLTYDAGTVNVVTDDYKEGAGALQLECTNLNDIFFQFYREDSVIDISEYTDGYLHFWLYINDTGYLDESGVNVKLTSNGANVGEGIQWTLTTLKSGWNEIVLNFSDATLDGEINYEAINHFSVSLLSSVCQTGLVVKLDDVRAVASGEILDCDTMDYYVDNGGTVNVTVNEYKEGIGAIRSTNSELVWHEFVREVSPVNISQYSDGRIRFWLYINDIEYLSSSPITVELGSAANSEDEKLEWILDVSELTDGWNRISLPIAAPDDSVGTIDLTAVDYFSISHLNSNTSLVTIVDDVRAMENEAQIMQTVYKTDDIVIADIVPTEMNYEVDSTGVEDSTDGIQAALDDCYEAGGGTVYLPTGEYKITKSINIPAYVTLRGDWQDPDEGTEYGTIINVEMQAVDETDADAVTAASQSGVFELQTNAGVIGLTVHYKEQSIEDVKIYPYTFYVVGGMLSTIHNVTVINGYRGIGASTASDASHESLQIDTFKGTFLNCGIELYYSSDVGTVQNVVINNKYWLQYDSSQDESVLESYTKANTTGMKFGDVEWSEFANISIEDCNVGIWTVEGKRGSTNVVQFTGSFYDLYIKNCEIGVQADYLDPRWGMNIARGSIEGSTHGIVNNTKACIQLCDVSVSGGIVETPTWWIVNDDTTITSSSWTKSNCSINLNKSEEDEENLMLSVTMTISDDVYNEIGTDQTLEVVLGNSQYYGKYTWTLPMSQVNSGENTLTWLFSEGSKSSILQPDLSSTIKYVKISGSTLNGVVIKEVKIEDIGGTVTTDSKNLSSKEIDYKTSYAKPDTRLLIANLNEENAGIKLQKCLDRMEKLGGGVVYVPGGTYRLYHAITVPAGVELRGSSSIATRDTYDECEGTLFLCYFGDEGGDTPFITLNGENAGLNGIRIAYANNGPNLTDTNKTLNTSYAIRGKASGVYVVNTMIAAAAYGIDFRDCDNHYIKGVFACCYYNTFYLGGTGGIITSCLQNPTVLERTAAPVHSDTWDNTFSYLKNGILKRDAHYIILEDAENELIYNVFAYGAMTMLTNIDSKNTQVMNIGTDKVGASSAQLVMDGGSLFGVNILRSDTTDEEAVSGVDANYIVNGIGSKSYKCVEGDLELHNRLNMVLVTGDVADESAVIIENDKWTLVTVDKIVGGKIGIGTTTSADTPGEGIMYADMSLASENVYMVNQVFDEAPNLGEYAKEDLALSFWYYSEVAGSLAGTQIELSSNAEDMDNNELTWYAPLISVQAGWNYIELPLDGSRCADSVYNCTDTFDLNNLETIRWFKTNDTTCDFKVTDLKIIILEPDSMEIPEQKTLLNCDSVEDLNVVSGGTFEVTTTVGEYAEGSGAFKTTGAATERLIMFLDTPVNIAAYENGTLHLSLYVNDKSNFTSKGSIYLEIGSARRSDCEELQWAIPLSNLKNGWNDIALSFEHADLAGIIHLGAVDYLRLYHTGNNDELVTILDDVYVTMQ